jgi:hypothetical protein
MPCEKLHQRRAAAGTRAGRPIDPRLEPPVTDRRQHPAPEYPKGGPRPAKGRQKGHSGYPDARKQGVAFKMGKEGGQLTIDDCRLTIKRNSGDFLLIPPKDALGIRP